MQGSGARRLSFKDDVLINGAVFAIWRLDSMTDMGVVYILLSKVSLIRSITRIEAHIAMLVQVNMCQPTWNNFSAANQNSHAVVALYRPKKGCAQFWAVCLGAISS